MRDQEAIQDAHEELIAGRKVGYARVSTSDQDLRLQLDALARDGVPEEGVYKETVSAQAKRRPKFDAMMREIRPGDMIVAWKPDRLFRSVWEWSRFLRLIEERGVKLRILTQVELDTSTIAGRLLANVLMAIAEFEADLTKERTVAGLLAAKARGRVGGARQTFTDEQIRHAKAEFDRGRTWKQVAGTTKALSGPRKGKAITVTRLRARVAMLEKQDAERAAKLN